MNFASNSLYVNSFLDITSKTIVTSLPSAPIPVNKMIFPYILDKLASAKNNHIVKPANAISNNVAKTANAPEELIQIKMIFATTQI